MGKNCINLNNDYTSLNALYDYPNSWATLVDSSQSYADWTTYNISNISSFKAVVATLYSGQEVYCLDTFPVSYIRAYGYYPTFYMSSGDNSSSSLWGARGYRIQFTSDTQVKIQIRTDFTTGLKLSLYGI